MKLSHQPDDPPYTMGHGGPRQGFVMVDRGDYWQCGYVLRKDSPRSRRGASMRCAPPLPLSPPPARMQEVTSWQDVHLLLRADRPAETWVTGCLHRRCGACDV